MIEELSVARLLNLLQLASPSLPVGAYSYSQGLEAAIDARIVTDEVTALSWIGDCLELAMARLEAPVLLRLYDAWAAGDATRIEEWSSYFVASRDTAELRAETLQMGASLAKLLRELRPATALATTIFVRGAEIPLPCAYAAAAVGFGIPRDAALAAYLFSWVENQVLAAVKAVPLGQVAGQRMLLALAPVIERAAQAAAAAADDDLANWTPALSILSMRHETQYTRLFRS